MTKYYKVLNGLSPIYGQPTPWKVGKWMPEIEGDLVACKNGYHLCAGYSQLLEWLGPNIYIAEWRGDKIDAGDKIVVRQARIVKQLKTWNKRTKRLFAADCAERVLHIYERYYPGDSRVRDVIEISRKVARGELPASGLTAAATAA